MNMNPIDVAILGVMALCVLFGLYRGFIQSLLGLGGSLISIAGSFWLFPHMSDFLRSNTSFTRFISTYTDSASLLGDLDLSSLSVNGLSADTIRTIVEKADLPQPLGSLLQSNLDAQVFAPLGNLATTVGDYVNQTVLNVSINVICFLLCFVVCFIAVLIISNLLRVVFSFPVLKHLDSLAGGMLGFLTGIVLCYAAFTLLPLLKSVIPLDEVQELIAQSRLAQVFQSKELIMSIMNRHLS